MADDQFREKTWAEEQSEARRILDEQAKEQAADTKQAANARAAAADAALEQTPEAADQARGARFSRAMAAARGNAGAQKNAQGRRANQIASPELAALDKQISNMAKKAESGWQKNYLMLVVGAGVTDLLQIFGDATVVLSLLSSLIGLVYSATRYIVLRFEARKLNDRDLEKAMLTRTLAAGLISIIPLINMLPENLTAMLLEWQARKKIADVASVDLKKLRAQKEVILAQQAAEGVMEAELLAAA